MESAERELVASSSALESEGGAGAINDDDDDASCLMCVFLDLLRVEGDGVESDEGEGSLLLLVEVVVVVVVVPDSDMDELDGEGGGELLFWKKMLVSAWWRDCWSAGDWSWLGAVRSWRSLVRGGLLAMDCRASLHEVLGLTLREVGSPFSGEGPQEVRLRFLEHVWKLAGLPGRRASKSLLVKTS